MIKMEERIPLRICRVCGETAYTEEDLTRFCKDKKSLHGRENLCKPCSNHRYRNNKLNWANKNEGYYHNWLLRNDGHSYIKKDGRGVERWHTVKGGRWRPRSCVVMEEILGRPLKRGEVVHHINEDVLDDRPENLRLMKKSDHVRLHHRARK